MDDCLPLSLLSAGQSGRISHVLGRADCVHRLHEMGLRDGALIEILHAGRPCIIRLDGQRLCVRDDDLLSVLVRPVVTAVAAARTTHLAAEPAS